MGVVCDPDRRAVQNREFGDLVNWGGCLRLGYGQAEMANVLYDFDHAPGQWLDRALVFGADGAREADAGR